jgi:hypothetical protein
MSQTEEGKSKRKVDHGFSNLQAVHHEHMSDELHRWHPVNNMIVCYGSLHLQLSVYC